METVVFTALVWKIIDFIRHLANLAEQKSAVATQLLAWVAGVGLVAVGAHADATAGIVLPGATTALSQLDGWSQVLVGLLIASTASSAVDIKQALDGSDSASKPPLLGGPPAPPAN